MHNRRTIVFLGLAVLNVLAVDVHSQASSSEPAQAVVVFLAEPSEFEALSIDGAPFASLDQTSDFAGIWPVEAIGNKRLVTKIKGSKESGTPVQFVSGKTTLLFLGVTSAPGGGREAEVRALYPDIPKPESGKKGIFVISAPGSSGFTGKMLKAGENKFADVQFPAGKLVPLGADASVLKVAGEVILAGNPQSSGVHVFVLTPQGTNSVKAVGYSLIAPEPATAPTPQ